MIPLSLVLKERAFALTTATSALVMLAGTLAYGPNDADDTVFLMARCVPLAILLLLAGGEAASTRRMHPRRPEESSVDTPMRNVGTSDEGTLANRSG